MDCEVTVCNLYGEIMLLTVAMSFLAENQYPTYQLLPLAVKDNGGLNYSLLVAYNANPSSVSPAYLTFEELEQQPMVQSDVDKATIFPIS